MKLKPQFLFFCVLSFLIFSFPTSIFADTEILRPNAVGDSTQHSNNFTQFRSPTSDLNYSGTWDVTTNMWSYVDDPISDPGHDSDTTRLVHGTTAGNVTFGFNTLSVPAGVTIVAVKVNYFVKDVAVGTNSIGGRILVGDTYSNSSLFGPLANPGSGYGIKTASWAVNPITGIAWTVDDVNGVGSNALLGFGVNSADANPQVAITQVYLEVVYRLASDLNWDTVDEEISDGDESFAQGGGCEFCEPHFYITIKENGVASSVEKTISSSYAEYSNQWDTRLSDSGNWTIADINTLQIGFETVGDLDWFSLYNLPDSNVPVGSTINFIKVYANAKKLISDWVVQAMVVNLSQIYVEVDYTLPPPNTTPTLSSLGPTTLVDGSTTNDTTPTFTFTTTDGEDNNLAYELTIDNDSDFSSPTYQATSSYATPGAISTTTASLPDASYYWRVLVGDGNATSTYTTANDGEIAFIIDTYVPPTITPTTISGSRRLPRVIPVSPTTAVLGLSPRALLIAQIESQLQLLITELRMMLAERGGN